MFGGWTDYLPGLGKATQAVTKANRGADVAAARPPVMQQGWRDGQAQPIPPPAQGTPYGQQPAQITDMEYRGNIPIPKGAPRSVVDYMMKNPDKWTRGQPTRRPQAPQVPNDVDFGHGHYPLPVRPQPIPPQGGGNPYPSFGTGGYNPGWGVMPGPAVPPHAVAPGMTQPAPSPQTPSYQQPANGTSRTDPGSGKMVTYKNGQWTWEPNPISGPQPYDTSRFGDGTPPNAVKPGAAESIAPPSQGDPYAVKDVSSLPFYKELMVGDTVRKRDDGQYDVYDQSGAAIQRYNSSGNLTVAKKGGRSGQTMWLSTPEGQAEQAATLKRLEEQEAPRRDAAQKDADAKLARLGQLRNQQFAYVKNKKGGGYTPPSWDKEYQDLMKWAMSPETYTSVNEQQFRQIADWFPGTFGGNPNAIRR